MSESTDDNAAALDNAESWVWHRPLLWLSGTWLLLLSVVVALQRRKNNSAWDSIVLESINGRSQFAAMAATNGPEMTFAFDDVDDSEDEGGKEADSASREDTARADDSVNESDSESREEMGRGDSENAWDSESESGEDLATDVDSESDGEAGQAEGSTPSDRSGTSAWKKDHVIISGAKQAWGRANEYYRTGAKVKCLLVRKNSGGFLVRIPEFGLSGFLPKSHIRRTKLKRLFTEKIHRSHYLNEPVTARVVDVDRPNRQVIVSQTLDASGAKRFAPGTVHEGVVRRITPFGVFVELEKRVVGLLHVSHASHGHVDDLHSIFAVGDRIKCMAIKMKSRARLKSVSLSTKFLEPTPGDMLVNPAMVYEKAEETAKLFMEEKRAQRKSKHAAKERETLTPVA